MRIAVPHFFPAIKLR